MPSNSPQDERRQLDEKALDTAMHSVHGYDADDTGDYTAMLWINARSIVTAYLAAVDAPAPAVGSEGTHDAL